MNCNKCSIEKPIEEYLISENYQVELRNACSEFIDSYFSREVKKNEEKSKVNENDDGLKEFMEKYKVKTISYVSDNLNKILDDTRRLPPKIKQLFEAIKTKLNS